MPMLHRAMNRSFFPSADHALVGTLLYAVAVTAALLGGFAPPPAALGAIYAVPPVLASVAALLRGLAGWHRAPPKLQPCRAGA
jgi:hypothetical protein